MKIRYTTACLLLFLLTKAWSQPYSLQQLEAAFLENNYLLIAAKFDVNQAEAAIVQERLWDNPSLSISEINLWSNRSSEQFARLFGEYGRTQQFAVELEQLVETAGKRKKRVVLRELEKRSAVFEYEEVLRDLKKELRQSYYELYTVNEQEAALAQNLAYFDRLQMQYKVQSERQNVARADWVRIQSELISLGKEQAELVAERLELLGKLQVLTQIGDLKLDQLAFTEINERLQVPIPTDLYLRAMEANLHVLRQNNETDMAKGQVDLEIANRKPDLTFQLGYDRGGNIMQDFVGIGISLDLPVFNRNKGNISAARYRVKEQEARMSALEIELATGIGILTEKLDRYKQSLTQWSDQEGNEQQSMLASYLKNLQSGQVTLLEFIDFAQAWREANQSIVEVQNNYLNTYEELQYIVGSDF